MIYLDLFLGFLKVGCFAFGGAYAAIPLIRDVVLGYGWLTDEALSYMIAVSESTPGPIMVNLATYVGSSQAGVLGAALATLAVVTPAFLIILLIMCIFRAILKNPHVQAVLKGLKPCVMGIILGTGAFMSAKHILPLNGKVFDWRNLLTSAILVAAMIGYNKWKKKRMSPITLIVIAAVLGVAIYGI
ncbi:MAG: chromate transporter [Clostridia bacterium]|nr:chromate transporter [Clostridia bacterium]